MSKDKDLCTLKKLGNIYLQMQMFYCLAGNGKVASLKREGVNKY